LENNRDANCILMRAFLLSHVRLRASIAAPIIKSLLSRILGLPSIHKKV
jgi:hypothetical protein